MLPTRAHRVVCARHLCCVGVDCCAGANEQHPFGAAAVALLFRSVELHPRVWLYWDAVKASHGVAWMLAAAVAVHMGGGLPSWLNTDEVGDSVTKAELHDILYDLLEAAPVFLTPEASGVHRCCHASLRACPCALTPCAACVHVCASMSVSVCVSVCVSLSVSMRAAMQTSCWR